MLKLIKDKMWNTDEIVSSRNFILLREERSQFQGLRNENFVEIHLKASAFKGENDTYKFSVDITSFKQSNANGMFKWVGDLHELREKIVFSLDENGQLGKIHNLEDIQMKWKHLKPKIFLRHKDEKYKNLLISGVEALLQDDERLSATLRYSMPYLLLFPGIHNNEFKKNEVIKGYREIPNFIAAKNIPIITDEVFKETEDGKYEINVTGRIDEEHFEQNKVTAMLRILKNRPRVPTIVELKYLEKYLLEDWPWSSQSMCMSLVQIPGSLYYEEKNILKMITI
ncbi:hypothetical protein MKJ01_18225 [Chryseobacterium sp. SSA4.19]|uniref:hypothetical protein n=1 Tax=Chryseobacterium sp. SSA4.19 TaxID=2919915 RepID=UPI001F4E4C4E|nr:hypothetical protein [Chryseobacterium sp. SSA4.19]MCJ8155695.1 hypothetical protein [Chryseobacterium sp. SSA4.19]